VSALCGRGIAVQAVARKAVDQYYRDCAYFKAPNRKSVGLQRRRLATATGLKNLSTFRPNSGCSIHSAAKIASILLFRSVFYFTGKCFKTRSRLPRLAGTVGQTACVPVSQTIVGEKSPRIKGFEYADGTDGTVGPVGTLDAGTRRRSNLSLSQTLIAFRVWERRCALRLRGRQAETFGRRILEAQPTPTRFPLGMGIGDPCQRSMFR
jgi:hypothetical protein